MAALIRFFAVGMAAGSTGAVAMPPPSVPSIHAYSAVERWRTFIAEASRRFGIPEAWIAAVMQAESGGRTQLGGRQITSRAGAMGLMQLMPATYAAMRARCGLGADPYDPHDNILAGAAYLRIMYDRFGYPGMFAAYNAGPGRYAAHIADGNPLPAETRAYIAQLAQMPATPSMPPAILSGTWLFFALGRSSPTSFPVPSNAPATIRKPPSSNDLFVPLSASPGEER